MVLSVVNIFLFTTNAVPASANCRAVFQVTLLFPSFTEDELNSAELDDIEARDHARAESSDTTGASPGSRER